MPLVASMVVVALFFTGCGQPAGTPSAVPASTGTTNALRGDNSKRVILLVHGMTTFDIHRPSPVWGQVETGPTGATRWTGGLIADFESAGLSFGGIIRPGHRGISLPGCLDRAGGRANPSSASVFALHFSPSANTDGLALKALELAECIGELRRYTGSAKVHLVAYSAGGVVARAYVQNALPGVRYRDDVDRLITISTPHLGCGLAEHWGDFLGTRATCLKPSNDFIRKINDELELPDNVRFASLVVRGIGVGMTGLHKVDGDVDRHIDHAFLRQLAPDFRMGTDQVIDVRSQNLALARCARRYEERTRRPVHFLVARVPDPTPQDTSPGEEKVHEVAPKDETIRLMCQLLIRHPDPWTDLVGETRDLYREYQVATCCFGLAELATAEKHPHSEIVGTGTPAVAFVRQDGQWHRYEFSASAQWVGRYLRIRAGSCRVAGWIEVRFDRHGRICDHRHGVTRVEEM